MPEYAKFSIPKRSPDLNVLDYHFWNEVERHLRKAEHLFPEDKKETRDDFIIRLNKTALSIPPADVSKVIGDLAKRCELLYRAKGGLFEESEEL